MERLQFFRKPKTEPSSLGSPQPGQEDDSSITIDLQARYLTSPIPEYGYHAPDTGVQRPYTPLRLLVSVGPRPDKAPLGTFRDDAASTPEKDDFTDSVYSGVNPEGIPVLKGQEPETNDTEQAA